MKKEEAKAGVILRTDGGGTFLIIITWYEGEDNSEFKCLAKKLIGEGYTLEFDLEDLEHNCTLLSDTLTEI